MTESYDSRGRSLEQLIRDWFASRRGAPSVGARLTLPWRDGVEQVYTVREVKWFKPEKFKKRRWYLILEAQCVMCSERFKVSLRNGGKSMTRTCERHRGQAPRTPRSETRHVEPVEPVAPRKVEPVRPINSREVEPRKVEPVDPATDAIVLAAVGVLDLVSDVVDFNAVLRHAAPHLEPPAEGERDMRKVQVVQALGRLSSNGVLVIDGDIVRLV